MRVKVYFQMSINLYNAEIEEEKHLITLGHHTTVTSAVKSSLYALFVRGKADLNFEENLAVS